MIYLTMKLYALFFIGMRLLEARVEASNKFMYYLWSGILIIYAPVFIVLDVLFDIVIGSIYFLRLPEWFFDSGIRDSTFTARLKYMKRTEDPDEWRYKLAVKFCRLLNHADPDHC